MANLEMRNMPDHYPQRGDQVESWLQDRRDAKGNKDSHGSEAAIWFALDELLDEYRDAADSMMSLENVVNGEDNQPKPLKKKKRDKR